MDLHLPVEDHPRTPIAAVGVTIVCGSAQGVAGPGLKLPQPNTARKIALTVPLSCLAMRFRHVKSEENRHITPDRAPSRHSPGLQTTASRCVGRVARPRSLTAAWVWALRQTQGTCRYSDKTQHAVQDPHAQKIRATDHLNVHFANERDAPESGPRRNA